VTGAAYILSRGSTIPRNGLRLSVSRGGRPPGPTPPGLAPKRPSSTIAHAVKLEQVRRPGHPHRGARDDHDHVVVAHGAVAQERRLDLLDHLVGRLPLVDEPRGDAPEEPQT